MKFIGQVMSGALLFGVASYAAATSVSFDFSTLGGNDTNLGTGASTVAGIKASAYVLNGVNWQSTNLWLRNQTNDRGLGVCSEAPPTTCDDGGNGDTDELSRFKNVEVILLERPDDARWSQLIFSSLDSGDGDGHEEGTIYFGDSAALSANQIIQDVISGNQFRQFRDDGAAIGPSGVALTLGSGVERGLDFATLDAALSHVRYLVLRAGKAGEGKGDVDGDGQVDPGEEHDDYLVWKGAYEVPAPLAAPLMLLGLLGVRRRVA